MAPQINKCTHKTKFPLRKSRKKLLSSPSEEASTAPNGFQMQINTSLLNIPRTKHLFHRDISPCLEKSTTTKKKKNLEAEKSEWTTAFKIPDIHSLPLIRGFEALLL